MKRVALFEDNGPNMRLLKLTAEMRGHRVAHVATSLVASLKLVEQVAQGEIQPAPDAWIVDGNLGSGPDDGPRVVQLIRARGLSGIIIGNSANPWDNERAPVDADARKDPTLAMDLLDSTADHE